MENLNKNLIILVVSNLIVGMYLIFVGLFQMMYGDTGLGIMSILVCGFLLTILFNFITELRK